MKKFLLGLMVCCIISGCDKAKAARDAIATDYGWITTAQAQHLTECRANPAASTCVLINKAIGIHNTSIDLLHAYCSGPTPVGGVPYDNGGPCVEVASAQQALLTAVNNLNAITADVKKVVN